MDDTRLVVVVLCPGALYISVNVSIYMIYIHIYICISKYGTCLYTLIHGKIVGV